MSDTIDAKTLELIASKICHDLISPIGAINNGVEIFEELGPDGGAEVIELIAASAQIASAKLKAYRLAYGAGGSDATITIHDAHHVLSDILEHEKRVTQDWDPAAPLFDGEMAPVGFAKITTAFLLLTLECLPKGGVIGVRRGDHGTVIIEANGDAPLLRDNFEDALRQSVALEDLPPALTHAFMTGFLATHYGFTLENIAKDEESLQFIVKLPA